jgi:hypothetical protein
MSVCCFLLFLLVAVAWGKGTPTDQLGWFVDMRRFSASAHNMLKCEDCHVSIFENGLSHPNTNDKEIRKKEARRVFDYKICEKCHKKSYERYLLGDHATAMVKEKETGQISKNGHAPVCGDCHSAHYTKSHLSRIEIGKEQTDSCGRCHPDQKKSYLDNYHGKAAVNLGYDKSALCTDCHGGHEVHSLRDSALALKACQRCHPEAQAQFANIIIHDSRINVDKKNETKQSGLKVVHTLSIISFIFIISIIIFFYSHSCLLLMRKLQDKLRKHK